jgi:hypothetical protein
MGSDGRKREQAKADQASCFMAGRSSYPLGHTVQTIRLLVGPSLGDGHLIRGIGHL